MWNKNKCLFENKNMLLESRSSSKIYKSIHCLKKAK